MSRPPRVEMAGGIYHVIARGNERREIFRDDQDRRLYLARLAQCRERYAFRVLAFCLMPNHVHLAIERGPVDLAKIVLALHSFYSQKFNRRHDRVGHLFQGRYKAFLVERDLYLETLVRYIHHNPVKARLVERSHAYRWSSDRFYRSGSGPEWLDLDLLLKHFGPTPARAAAAYRSWAGSASANSGGESYDEAIARGRVVKGGEEFVERTTRIARVVLPSPAPLTPGALARAASRLQGFSFERLRDRSRGHPESQARYLAAHIGRRDYGLSTSAMAACFGRDESTFAHGLRRLDDRMSRDRALCLRVDKVASAIRAEVARMQVRPQESDLQGRPQVAEMQG